MLAKRIIPCLDVKDGRVVKGVHFLNLRDAGDPVEQAVIYDRARADELVFLDITATHEKRDTVRNMVRAVADNVFIPFTVGGGVRTVDDIRAILLAGADKVSINSAAVRRPEFITEGAKRFGSQCILRVTVHRRSYRLQADGPDTLWVGGVRDRRTHADRRRCARMGQGGGGPRRGRDFVDQHGCGRHARRV